MIQANELRIGNWIWADDVNMPYQLNDFGIIVVQRSFENRSPIPLTPEILEKCGFQKSVENENYFMDNVMDINIDITYVPLNGYQLYFHQTFIRYIHSVHELQNIYFELKGTELIINL